MDAADVPESMLRRKGSTTTAGVPEEVRSLLNDGRIETVNLAEWLVVDQAHLAVTVFGELGAAGLGRAIADGLARRPEAKAPARLALVAETLVRELPAADRESWFQRLASHRSDTVRSWAALMLPRWPGLPLADGLLRVRPLAADPNMGVREVAWMALREPLASDLEQGVRLLVPWTSEPDFRLRRFASEVLRPRGVWCRHIARLKEEPEIARVLLDPLRADAAKYVQDSVANWLNDASKSRPEWVRALTDRWLIESPVEATRRIVHRALRTLRQTDSARTVRRRKAQ